MKQWSKEEALTKLEELAGETDRLKGSQPFSTEHTLWLTKCHDILEEIFGRASRYYVSFVKLTWGPISGTIIDPLRHGGSYERATDAVRQQALIRDLGTAKGLLLGAADYLKERNITEVYSKRESGADVGLVLSVLNLDEQKLRKVIRDKPEKEKEVQVAFENLLIGADIPYGREVDSIEYSSKTYIPDFSLSNIDLAVEVKLCNRSEREKELPEEINDDILAYQTKYQNLLFVIYDLGYIRDVDRFSGSFEDHQNVTIRVVKH
ncbi:hypothetical protein ACFLUP_02795 [Chloroflexota bacterium]